MWRFIYNIVIFPLSVIARIASLKNEKLRQSIRGKKGLWERLDKQLEKRDSSKPLIWFHVPSYGELNQAQPVLERFLQQGYESAVTFNSVSASSWIQHNKIFADKQPVIMDFLPYDFSFSIRRWISKVKPSVLVFVKFDLWPNTIWETHKAGIPIYLISATLQPKAFRYTSVIGRSLFGNLYSRFSGIFTVSQEDRRRFLETRPGLSRIEVLGDTRYDSVIDRRDRLPVPEFPDYVHQKQVVVIGSSWPPDEECVFPGLKRALEKFPGCLIIVVPHEPTEEHLNNSERFFKDYKLIRLSQLNKDTDIEYDVILVDSVGKLSSIYNVGNMAFVGAGFTTGVHNVMEPCALGLPVAFGPIHYNSPEAVHMVGIELAFSVENETEFQDVLFRLLGDPEHCRSLGDKARHYVESQCGAAEKCFQIIADEIHEN
ncbi:MAG: 3-deoxy-D-manno-octulosonic acid transferase [Proteobacteria bacterium]|nr:3-deoxy-D-manno-octulosonic acid transferase [Pseudomonadota bacterium]